MSIEAAVTEVQLHKHSAITTIVGAYRPPSAKPDWYTNFNELISKAIKSGYIILMGDFNSDLWKPTVYPGKALDTCLKLAGVKIPSKDPTRISSTAATCLDIIAINKNLLCVTYKVNITAVSDHFSVEAELVGTSKPTLSPVLKRCYSPADRPELSNRLRSIHVAETATISVDEHVSKWSLQLLNILEDIAPIRSLLKENLSHLI